MKTKILILLSLIAILYSCNKEDNDYPHLTEKSQHTLSRSHL